MAYVSSEVKAKISEALKPVFKKYNIKATISRGHYYSSLNVNLREGAIDFGANDKSVNVYHIDNNYSGIAKEFLNVVIDTIKKAGEWFDESDSMTDYFHTAFYININVGKWDKQYIFINN
jgi:hypothetical protein